MIKQQKLFMQRYLRDYNFFVDTSVFNCRINDEFKNNCRDFIIPFE